MRVRVEFTAQLRQVVGCASKEYELPSGATVQDLISEIEQRHVDDMSGSLLLEESARLKPSILLFVGERQVTWSEETPLSDGDEVTLLSPISGG